MVCFFCSCFCHKEGIFRLLVCCHVNFFAIDRARRREWRKPLAAVVFITMVWSVRSCKRAFAKNGSSITVGIYDEKPVGCVHV